VAAAGLLIAIGIAALVGLAPALGARIGARARRRVPLRRAIARMETTPIAALHEGKRAKIRGVVSAREPLLTSPISERPCVGYRIAIDDASHDPDLSWDPLVNREDWPSFLVADETGTVAVQGPPFEILVDPSERSGKLPQTAFALLAEHDVRMRDLWSTRKFWFEETLLKVGDRVVVVGRPSLKIDAAGRGLYREPPRLFVMRGTHDEPIVVLDDDEPVG
jgi:hypothetical protein